MKVGLDVGGTKTDAVAVDAGGDDRRPRAPGDRLGPGGRDRTVIDAVARARRRTPASM